MVSSIKNSKAAEALSKSEEESPKVEEEQSKTEKESGKAEVEPSKVEEDPSNAEQNPSKAEEEPNKAEEEPNKAEEEPSKAKEESTKAEDKPNKGEAGPSVVTIEWPNKPQNNVEQVKVINEKIDADEEKHRKLWMRNHFALIQKRINRGQEHANSSVNKLKIDDEWDDFKYDERFLQLLRKDFKLDEGERKQIDSLLDQLQDIFQYRKSIL